MIVLFGASRWAAASFRPDTGSSLSSEAIGCAWATLVAFAFRLPKQYHLSRPLLTREPKLRWVLAGALLFAGPGINLFLPSRDLDASALTIALALTPVLVAIASTAFGTENSEGIPGRLWPGLASVAGLLLVLVQPSLGDIRTDVALILAPTLTGIGAVLFCVGPPRLTLRVPITLLGAASIFTVALAASLMLAHTRPSLSLIAIAADGVFALLCVFALDKLGASRWSSQFTWVPLLIILESLLLVRPKFTAYWFTGLILLVVSGIYLLLPQSDETIAEASPVPTTPR